MLSTRSRRRGRRLVRIAGAGALAGVLGALLGWLVTDRLEQDNDFCNACHLERGPSGVVPLHIQIREDFDRADPATLASLHGGARVEARPGSPAFRCIDCHGGASFLGKVRVKALAAQDAFFWLIGVFEEPDEMRWPLWDEDCRRCHERFAPPANSYATPAFHELPVHNAGMPVTCVECHAAHEPDGNTDAYFLHAGPVRRQCSRCHAEFEE